MASLDIGFFKRSFLFLCVIMLIHMTICENSEHSNQDNFYNKNSVFEEGSNFDIPKNIDFENIYGESNMQKRKNEFIRFGKRKNEFIRFGKRDNLPSENILNDQLYITYPNHDLFYNNGIHSAYKRKNEFIRFGKK
uniref:Uncharacterized protein n=1 Tax=Parastrongyloides trichosuri TaxID=131310 RepID=A0A0N4ZCM4_PARTI